MTGATFVPTSLINLVPLVLMKSEALLGMRPAGQMDDRAVAVKIHIYGLS